MQAKIASGYLKFSGGNETSSLTAVSYTHLNDIKRLEINQKAKMVTVGNWANKDSRFYNVLRTSDVMPKAFEEFYQATGDREWLTIKSKMLNYLQKLSKKHDTGLVPDFAWVSNNYVKPAKANEVATNDDGHYRDVYKRQGKCEVEINNKTFYLKAGNILLIEKDTEYTIKVSDKNAIIVKFKLDNDFSWQKQLEQVDANTPNEQRLSTLFLEKLNQDRAFLYTTTSVMWGSQNLKGIIQDYLNNVAFNGTIGLELLKIIILRNLREQNFKSNEVKESTFKDEALDQYIDQHLSLIHI